ncbi:aldo/keto reductase [Vibrio sp. PP-XX7]
MPNGGRGGEIAEIFLGNWLKKFSCRHDLVIATKFSAPFKGSVNNYGLSRKYILKSIDESLKRLNTDYIDIYQSHDDYFDFPMEETHRTLETLIQSGKGKIYWVLKFYSLAFNEVSFYM